MKEEPTPVPSLFTEEVEAELRDSRVVRKDQPVEEQGGAPRLRLVAREPGEADPPEQAAGSAAVIPLPGRGSGLVEAELLAEGERAEGRFHRRKAIELAVQKARTSQTPPPPLEVTARRAQLAVVGAVVVGAALALGLGLALHHREPAGRPASNGTLPALPLTTIQLDLKGVPQGATIRLDGTRVQGPSIALEPQGGPHTVSVEAAGFRPWVLTLVPAAEGELQTEPAPSPPARADRRQ